MKVNDKLPKINPFLLGIIIFSLVVGMLVYSHLPDRVPTHWNIRGEVDGYSGRFFGAFGLPLITLGVYILMVFLPRIDPQRTNYSKFPRAYNVVMVGLVLFFLSLYTITLLAAFNYPIDVGRFVRIAIGILFVAMGNYMTQIRHNYFFGIKTPWTLASETVWRKTHRLGGILYVGAGILILSSILTSDKVGFVITIGSVIAVIIISTIYSYLIFKINEG
ncbi:MAG: hypothetical protein PWQ96_205 [Clostridia bacterium]|jgi:uncharacterized membrane protein|nr:putative integral rane protein [Clostridiales bacterium]MDK2984563.1 hypothetical protein [Clostridia bacterium]